MTTSTVFKWIVAASSAVAALGAYAGLFGKYGHYVTIAATVALALNHSLTADTSK